MLGLTQSWRSAAPPYSCWSGADGLGNDAECLPVAIERVIGSVLMVKHVCRRRSHNPSRTGGNFNSSEVQLHSITRKTALDVQHSNMGFHIPRGRVAAAGGVTPQMVDVS